MAVRTPLYWDGTDLKEMSSAMIDELVLEAVRQYGNNHTVDLQWVAASGTLNSMDDTRLQAGGYLTSVSAFPAETSTDEPSQVTVTYDNISNTIATVSTPTDTNNKAFFCYYDSGSIVAMTLQDMIDTFGIPAVTRLTDGSLSNANNAGMYHVSTSTSVAGSTLLSANAIYDNTEANTLLYTAASIPEANDQPYTLTSYYLHRVNANTSYQPTQNPVQIDGSNDIQVYSNTNVTTTLADVVRHTTVNVAGRILNYQINTAVTGNSYGSAITDTRLQGGSGDYQTLFVGANDYRAQEFPDGTSSAANTYYLDVFLT